MPRGGALLAGLLLLLAACGGGSQPNALVPAAAPATPDLAPATVRLGHVASTAYAPLYLALDRGYFDRLNLKVQLVAIRAGQDPIDLVARGDVDAVVTDLSAGMFNGLARGLRFKVVGSMAAVPGGGSEPLVLEVAKPLVDSGRVKALADLKGRKIAIAGGSGNGGGYLADLALEKAGVGLESLTVVDLAAADMETAIASTGIDAALVPAPYTTAIEEHQVAAPMGAPPAGATWSGVLFGTKVGTSAGQRLFMALLLAVRDLQGPARTSDVTLATLAKYTGMTADVLKSVPPFDWDPALKPNAAELAAIQATYRKLGLLQYANDLRAAQYVNASYSKQAATFVH